MYNKVECSCLTLSYGFGLSGRSQRKFMTKDTILFLVTLPVMVVIVILPFSGIVPNLVKFFAEKSLWIFND